MQDAPRTAVELLGPVRLLVDGTPCNLGGPRPRALVARLALTPRRVVPSAELATALWGADVPPSAGQTLRTYASRLRTGPLTELLVREGPGWRLDLPDDAVDAVRFAALVQQAKQAGPAQESDLLRAALALWHGAPLADVQDAAFAVDEARRLAESRAAVQERLAELRLAAGEHRALVPELTAVVAAAPHREAPALLLATALSRSGRAGDAADVLTTLRRRLADDLGLDPSPAVDALQQQLLVHDPQVQAPRVVVPSQQRPVEGTPLPLPLTPFVGREVELAAVDAALGRSRLVTLTGAGGSGKTRIALEALRRLDRATTRAPDAVWLVELAGLPDPALLLDTVGQALGVLERTLDEAALVRALDGRRALLVLDTCEHLAEPVARLVERLLAGCAGLQVLATSREALGLPGECVLPVPPLVPAEAVALFAQRAESAAGRSVVDDGTRATVEHLVAALDGIPLALELAAARLSVLALDDVVGLLEDRFALLTGGSRTALPRHRTLRAAVQWSHDLLDADERRLFAAAGVFAGSFDLAALRAVCGPEVEAPTVGVLASLAAKSMVVITGEATTGRRYRLLDTLRAFAREQQDPELSARLQARHRHYYADLADAQEGALHGHERRAAHAVLQRERDELRAAFASAVAEGDAVVALRLVAAQSWHWFRRGLVGEGVRAARTALALADRPGAEVPAAVEAAAALGAATLHYLGGLGAEGMANAERAVRASERSANLSTRAVGLCYLGYWRATSGDLEASVTAFSEAGAHLAVLEPWARAEVLMTQGQLLRAQGEHAAALEVLEAAYAEGSACGHSWAALSARWIAAKVRLDLRQPEAARQVAAETARAFLADGDLTSTCACLLVGAAAASSAGDERQAAVLCGALDALGRRSGFRPEGMDVVDGPRHRACVREGLLPEDYAAAALEGTRLDLAAAVGLLEQLAAQAARRRRTAVTG